jgi:hypothetical protein
MELAGLCDICGAETHLTPCALCENRVCIKCYFPMKGICKACKEGGDTDLGNRSLDGKY